YHSGYERFLLDVGLFSIVQVSHLVPDIELCTTLIERWRPETNTFHMYHGEMTITLEDVSFITGLPVDGGAVFQEYPAKDCDWGSTIFRILGETPGKDDYAKDGRLKLTWLRRTFMHPSQIPSSYELRRKQYARAYALTCIGLFLMADRSGAAVHPVYLLLLERERASDDEYYAWGAASLAWLYREMRRSVFNLEGHGKA
ncbi:Serine/threonine-protein phosphatase 7 long form homolog, partial [Linum grandiflorum]